MKRLTAIALGVCCAQPAIAEWIAIGTSSNSAVWKADPSRIQTVNNTRRIWVKIDHSKDRSTAYRESMNLFAVDCSAGTYKLLSFTRYDSYGKVVESQSLQDYGRYGYEPIVPESMIEAVSVAACAGRE